MLLPLQGVTNERALTQGVASLALGAVALSGRIIVQTECNQAYFSFFFFFCVSYV